MIGRSEQKNPFSRTQETVHVYQYLRRQSARSLVVDAFRSYSVQFVDKYRARRQLFRHFEHDFDELLGVPSPFCDQRAGRDIEKRRFALGRHRLGQQRFPCS